jgi:hypothetical protein
MAVAAVLEHQSEPADISEDGLYEFVLNTDGSTTKITHKNSKGRRCKKCGCRMSVLELNLAVYVLRERELYAFWAIYAGLRRSDLIQNCPSSFRLA